MIRSTSSPVVDVSDQPFRPQLDIVLDLPAPLSVNRTRRINWAAQRGISAWTRVADASVMAHGRLPDRVLGPFQVTIIFPQGSRLDLDNGAKQVIDYLRRIELIQDDSPRYMKRVILEFGDAPEGCRVVVRVVA